MFYPSGYGAAFKQRTLVEHVAYGVNLRVMPEVLDRAQRLCTACGEAGHLLGFGGGWRSSTTQLNGFLSVHHRVATKADSDGCFYDGSWWAQNPLTIHKAPPGLSYHEGLPPAADLCAAIDMVGDQVYMQTRAAEFGLRVFGKIDYPHVQPIEWPASRISWNATMLPLKKWNSTTPPSPQEHDMTPLDPPYRTDTRVTNTPLAAGEVRQLAVMYGGTTVMINLTVVPIDGQGGYLTAFSGKDATPPNSSNVNWSGKDGPVANLAYLGTNGGWIKVRASVACHLITDTVGYQP